MARVVDLTRIITPGKEKFRLDVDTYQVKDYIPGFRQAAGDWHIIQDIHVCSHIGTHVEAPLHHIKGAKDIAQVPLDRLMGPAVRLDFRHKGRGGVIDRKDLERLGDRIRRNDIVILWVGWDKHYNKPQHLERPSLSFEAAKFLAARRIKCIGVDASGVEVSPKAAEQPNHHLLLRRGILIIEELTNLGSIRKERFTFIGLPLPIRHVDSSPIRAIAVED